MEQRREKSTIRRPGTSSKVLTRFLLAVLDFYTVAVVVTSLALTWAALVFAALSDSNLLLKFNDYGEHATELLLVSLGIPLAAWRIPTWFVRATTRDIEKEEEEWS